MGTRQCAPRLASVPGRTMTKKRLKKEAPKYSVLSTLRLLNIKSEETGHEHEICVIPWFLPIETAKKMSTWRLPGGSVFQKNKTVFLLLFASKHVSLDKNQCIEALPRGQKMSTCFGPQKQTPNGTRGHFVFLDKNQCFETILFKKRFTPKGAQRDTF